MTTVGPQSHFMFGLRTGVSNNVCFSDEQTLVFPAGNNCVCYNTVQRCQRFIPGSERSLGMHALAISANRRYLAVSERVDKATITVFDLQHEQGRKRKVVTAGEIPVERFVCMAFSSDSKYLIGQAADPEWTLVLWLWEKQKILASVKTSTSNNPVSQVSFNPYNNMQLCVSGAGMFKLFHYAEGTLKQSSFPKVETINFLCHTWMTAERLIAGTDTGRLLVFECGELRREIKTSPTMIKNTPVEEASTVCRITAILSYSKGFVCSMGPGSVCLFEKTEENSYRRIREIKVKNSPGLNKTLKHNQMAPPSYYYTPHTRQQCVLVQQAEEQLHFEFLSQPFHSKSITGLSTCLWKPLAATSSLDCSIRIWNYETKLLELYKEFQEEAYSVSLHPTGLFVLVGFADKLRLMNLVLDDIRTFKEFNVRGCRECAFSNGGHMFAAVNGNIIQIYSVMSFTNILTLKGHNGKVSRSAIKWSVDDRRLVSCGMDGAVYEWNTQSGKRESESVLKSCSYTDVAFSSDCTTTLAVGSDLTLKEIQEYQVLREVPGDGVAQTAIAVSHSGRVVFTGTSSGAIRAVKYPLPIQKDWTTHQAHCGPVSKMVITFDDQFLLTASEDGCLLIWKIIDKEGRGLKNSRHVIHTKEILVTKSDLEEKTQNMLELKMHLEELQMENEYQLRLKDMNYNEKIREITDNFTQQIEALQTTQQVVLKTEMEKQKCGHQESFAELAGKHSKELEDLELSYSQKLIVEHERFQEIQLKLERMQKSYESQLQSAEDHRVQALEDLTQSYEAKVQEKTQLLAQCQEDAKQQILEYKELIRQVEEDEDKMIHKVEIKYEMKLLTEKETNTSLKGESTILGQKVLGLQKQIDDKCTDINKLKQERQRLLKLIRSLESDIDDLKRQIAGHEKTNQDKTIASLKKKNQELEKLKFVLDFHCTELKKQIEPQQDEINEKKERIHQEDLVQSEKRDSQQKLAMADLRLKLRTRDRELHKQMQKVKHLETHLQRFKSDLHNCVGLIQQPKTLKDSVQRMYAYYVSEVENNVVDEDVQKAFYCYREHLEKTVSSLKTRLTKSAEEHERAYVRIMKKQMKLHHVSA
uniref:Cilia and flagella associated protein 57 n=1 Tax=Cynoglossus semilaevis TaxID=244447 RepID=A0A3P8WGP1_CYNSE